MLVTTFVLTATPLIAAAAPGSPAPGSPDRFTPGAPDPADAAATIHVPDGFVVELVAAEPLVMDPVAFAWGPDGKLWVVEMADYNWLPVEDPNKAKGRVVYLTDSDGDGRYDKRTVFLDDLNYPNGVMPWRNGVLITAAPDILYAEDTTPDDDNPKADKRQVLYTGFKEGNPQLRINGLAWGLDGWIYCANGLSHGKVTSTKTGKVVDISGRDLRIRPDTGDIEPATGPSQFGRVRDDFGNWFGCNNSDLIRHYVLPDHYLRRNPHVTYPDPVVSLVQPRNPPLFARGDKVARFHADYMAGRFTSACGLHIYRDTLLDRGEDIYYHNAFICEPVHNLVTRRVLVPDGVTFKAERAPGEEQSEWLTSTDNWFRPVMVRTGPDGAIWIADMYRAVIEHAQWAPKEVHEQFAQRHGHERGRIYRVYRKHHTKGDAANKQRPTPRIGPALMPNKPAVTLNINGVDPRGLAAMLKSPNGYVRDMVHMKLLWGRATEAAPTLDGYVTQIESAPVTAQVHAVWLMHNLGVLLVDSWSGSRSALPSLQFLATMKTAETFAASNHADVVVSELGLMDILDNDLLIIQHALTLGEFRGRRAGRRLSEYLLDRNDEPYIAAAVLSSAVPHAGVILDTLLQADKVDLSSSTLHALTATIVGTGDVEAIARAMSRIATARDDDRPYAGWQMQAMTGLLQALAGKGRILNKLVDGDDGPLKKAANEAMSMVEWAIHPSQIDHLPIGERVLAVQLYGLSGMRDTLLDLQVSVFLHRPDYPYELRRAAVEFFTTHGPGLGQHDILKKETWTGLTPALRNEAVTLMLRRTSRINHLLDRIESGDVQRFDLTAAHRQQLLQHKDKTIRERAAKLLGEVATDRAKVVEQFADAATLPGDVTRGRELFVKTCAVCHKLAGDAHGRETAGVGPDLSALTDQSPKFLLENILDPNRAADPRYLNYIAETDDGDVITGMLVTETGAGLTLLGPDGTRHDILRRDLTSLRSGGKSLMPEGLEQQLGEQGLADVIAYVHHRSAPRREMAGVKPRTITPGAGGVLQLDVRAAEAFGRAIEYVNSNNNIGGWTRGDDYLAWSVEGAAAGEYEVWLDYAAADEWKDNRFILTAESSAGESVTVTGDITSTTAANRYEQRKLATLKLNGATTRILLRPGGAITGELLRLRSLRLVPVKR